ncbi:MAG: Hpt domain-containing protein, partial [Paracoccus sp. (in: a-proteobacteria)]
MRVLKMYNDVGAQEFGPLVALFLEETETRLTHLGASPAQLLLDLHFLRGSALNLGFTNFGEVCLRAEEQLVDGQFDQVSRDDLIAAFTA